MSVDRFFRHWIVQFRKLSRCTLGIEAEVTVIVRFIRVSTGTRSYQYQESDKVKNLMKGEWTHVVYSKPGRIETLLYTAQFSETIQR